MSEPTKMASQLTAEWSTEDEHGKVTLDTWEDVQALVKRLQAASTPLLLQLYSAASGAELGVGLGREMAVFTYQASLDPPYFISLGDVEADGVTWFWYGREQTEYLDSNLVSGHLVDETIRAFVQALSRPATVQWEAL